MIVDFIIKQNIRLKFVISLTGQSLIKLRFVNFSCKLYNHKQIADVDLVLLFVYAQVTTTHNLKNFLAFCLILNFELSSAIVFIYFNQIWFWSCITRSLWIIWKMANLLDEKVTFKYLDTENNFLMWIRLLLSSYLLY